MFSNFIGIPFKNRESSFDSCDCYGLIRLIYKQNLNIEVPKPDASAFNSKDIESEFLSETSKNWREVQVPEVYDVVAMAHDPFMPDVVQHFGIYLGNEKMIHTLKGVDSHIVKMQDYKYYIKGFYRYG